MSQKLVVFFDPLGRTILGVNAGETADVLQVQNPAVLHAALNDQGKIQVNLIPAFFREFYKDWNNTSVFNYNKAAITVEANGNALEDKLVEQYENMFKERPDRATVRAQRPPVRELAPAGETKVPEKLNLFETVKTEEKPNG